MANKRKGISKKTRFEVFKRDSFTCQYCGKKAPDVVLNVDHIEPVSKGGKNSILNLITSCWDCNIGKSNRVLTDKSVIEKQQAQLEELQRKREQLKMMFQWQNELLEIEKDTTEMLSDYWQKLVPGYSLNRSGETDLKKHLKKFHINEIMEAMNISASQYLKFNNNDPDGPEHKSVETAWGKVGGICTCRRRDKDNPDLSRLYYVRGILRNRGLYVNERYVIPMLKDALLAGVDIEVVVEFSKEAGNWTEFREYVENETLRHEAG